MTWKNKNVGIFTLAIRLIKSLMDAYEEYDSLGIIAFKDGVYKVRERCVVNEVLNTLKNMKIVAPYTLSYTDLLKLLLILLPLYALLHISSPLAIATSLHAGQPIALSLLFAFETFIFIILRLFVKGNPSIVKNIVIILAIVLSVKVGLIGLFIIIYNIREVAYLLLLQLESIPHLLVAPKGSIAKFYTNETKQIVYLIASNLGYSKCNKQVSLLLYYMSQHYIGFLTSELLSSSVLLIAIYLAQFYFMFVTQWVDRIIEFLHRSKGHVIVVSRYTTTADCQCINGPQYYCCLGEIIKSAVL